MDIFLRVMDVRDAREVDQRERRPGRPNNFNVNRGRIDCATAASELNSANVMR